MPADDKRHSRALGEPFDAERHGIGEYLGHHEAGHVTEKLGGGGDNGRRGSHHRTPRVPHIVETRVSAAKGVHLQGLCEKIL